MSCARVVRTVGLVGELCMLVTVTSVEVPQNKLIKVGWDFPVRVMSPTIAL